MAIIGTDISEAKRWLDDNQVVGIPTETVYGLAGNALNPEAVLRIFKVKNRPSFDPLIVHVAQIEQVYAITEDIPEPLLNLAQAFWPGPLTLLLPRKNIIPDLVTSGLETVAIRIPSHPLTRSLLGALAYPLAAPSANPFGYISPTTARHVEDQLGDQVPYILDGGPATVGLESTITGLEEGKLIVFRVGGLSVQQLEEKAGTSLEIRPHSSSNPKAPGQLKSHYAPTIPVRMQDPETLLAAFAAEDIGVIAFNELDDRIPEANQVVLSETGDLDEAARHLFQALRTLDNRTLKIISAQAVPDQGLGKAINDRIRRGSARD